MMQEPESYSYAAFISYRHLEEDRRWAEWLVDALESYRTPEKLVHEGFPPRIGRIFRDNDELKAVPDLTKEIREALWASRFLVVVCSPETPRSDWVRAEIALFHAWGRGDRIVPVLVEGSPATSYPPELKRTEVIGTGPQAEFRTVEPRGADVSPKQGKSEAELREFALLTIAASALGCAFDALRDRHEERERKRTSNEWFDQVVWRRQAPVGVVPLTPEMVAARQQSFRLDSLAGRVVRVRRENSAGVLLEVGGVAQWEISWRDDGSVEMVEERSRHGAVRLRRRCNRDATKIDLTHEDDSAAPLGGIATGYGLGDKLKKDYATIKSTIVRLLVAYDDAEWPVRTRYCRDAFDTPEADALGHYGEWEEVNSSGQVVRGGMLDQAGQPMVQGNGVAQTAMHFAKEGWLAGWMYLGEDGKPINIADGFASVERVHDAAGNIARWFVRDAAGEPCFSLRGFCEVRNRFDLKGNLAEYAVFGPDGLPCLATDGCAAVCQQHDERGQCTASAYFGVDGAPVLNRNGFARFTQVYDARGNVTVQAYFGVDGAPVLNRDGFAQVTYVHDTRGNVTEQAYFGEDGAPVLQRDGFARLTQVHDARGNLTEQAYFGVDGAPVLNRNGFARFTQVYDSRGNLTDQAYFGVDGAPVLRRDGFARLTAAYDARGNLTEEAYFGVDGVLALHRKGYARLLQIHDARSNITGVACLGVDGAPVLISDGFATLSRVFDFCGNVTEEAYFGVDGAPVLNVSGYAKVVASYDPSGRCLSHSYFGRNGSPVIRLNKTCDHEEDLIDLFGDWRAVMLTCLFDDPQSEAIRSGGFARFAQVRDGRGDVLRRDFRGLRDEFVNGPEGFASINVDYAFAGKPSAIRGFTADGTPAPELHIAYTPMQDATSITFRLPDGTPWLSHQGFAEMRLIRDRFQQHVETQFFDAEGTLVGTQQVGS
jgi:MTH538 TIR-like domain (DUF1863)